MNLVTFVKVFNVPVVTGTQGCKHCRHLRNERHRGKKFFIRCQFLPSYSHFSRMNTEVLVRYGIPPKIRSLSYAYFLVLLSLKGKENDSFGYHTMSRYICDPFLMQAYDM